MDTELHVLYHSSDSYIVPTSVSIYSLLKNNRHIKNLYIHLISNAVKPGSMKKVEDIASRFGRTIDWIDGTSFWDTLEKYGCVKWRGSYSSYTKIFAPNIIHERYPNAKNLVYIDSDTVVLGSLADLETMELHDNDVAGVYELMPKIVRDKTGVQDKYINIGVMVINLDNWQKHSVESKMLDQLTDEQYVKSLMFAEQDIYNKLLVDSIQRLPLKYNVTTFNYFLRPGSKYARKQKIKTGFYSDEEYDEAVKNPTIVHYIELWTGRPWDTPNVNPYTPLYEQYKSECLPNETVMGSKRTGWRKIARVSMMKILQAVPLKLAGEIVFILLYLYNTIGL